MDKEIESRYQDRRLFREIGRPYFLPFFVMFVVAIFGEFQVAIATLETPTDWTSSFLFSHFGLFLSLSILTMAGVVWAIRYGISENQRRFALASLTVVVVMLVFFWPISAEPLTPVFRLSVTSVESIGSDIVAALRDASLFMQ